MVLGMAGRPLPLSLPLLPLLLLVVGAPAVSGPVAPARLYFSATGVSRLDTAP